MLWHSLFRWITDYFYAADSSHDGHLEFEEVWALLQRMSVKMSKKEAKLKFHVSYPPLTYERDAFLVILLKS